MNTPRTTRSSFLPPAILVALVVAGCTQPPLRNSPALSAEAARYGVTPELLVKARSAGYSPESDGGKTVFCTEQAQSFSYIPKKQCLGTTQMTLRLQRSGAALGELQRRISTMPPEPVGAAGP